MKRTFEKIIFSVTGCLIFYLVSDYFLGIYPFNDDEPHLRETVGDVYIIYLVIGLSLLLFLCINHIFDKQVDLQKKLDEIEKKIDSIESAISPKTSDSSIDQKEV